MPKRLFFTIGNRKNNKNKNKEDTCFDFSISETERMRKARQ